MKIKSQITVCRFATIILAACVVLHAQTAPAIDALTAEETELLAVSEILEANGIKPATFDKVKRIVWGQVQHPLGYMEKRMLQLDLSGLRLKNLPDHTLKLLSALRVLKIENNEIEKLPDDIGSLINLTELNASHNTLFCLPATIGKLVNLKVLDLSGNMAGSLPSQIGSCRALQKLYASSCRLTHLPPEIGKLSNLTHLGLANNTLYGLPAELGNLRKLNWLYLSNNTMVEFPSTLGNCTELAYLIAGNNWLYSLPKSIGSLRKLTTLHVDNNRMVTLPAEIMNCAALTQFKADYNRLCGLPANLAAFVTSKGVKLGSAYQDCSKPVEQQKTERLVTICHAESGGYRTMQVDASLVQGYLASGNLLGQCPATVPDINKKNTIEKQAEPTTTPSTKTSEPVPVKSDTQVTVIPSAGEGSGATVVSIVHTYDLARMDSLQIIEILKKCGLYKIGADDVVTKKDKEGYVTEIDLSGRNISELPAELCNLSRLKSLDVNGNNLTSLPPEIGNLKELEKLDCSGNNLVELPKEIVTLPNLKELDCSGNKLSMLPPEIGKLKNLEKLDCSGNKLPKLPEEICALPKLKELDCSKNQLKKLPDELCRLSTLEELDASDNALTTLPECEPENLKKVDLSNNNITCVPREFAACPELKMVDLSGNPLDCRPVVIVERPVTESGVDESALSGEPSVPVYLPLCPPINPADKPAPESRFVKVPEKIAPVVEILIECPSDHVLDSLAKIYLNQPPREAVFVEQEEVCEICTGAKEWLDENEPDWEDSMDCGEKVVVDEPPEDEKVAVKEDPVEQEKEKEPEKVVICHIPPGEPENAHTIEISVNAVPAHLAHGDYLGPCDCSREEKKQAKKEADKAAVEEILVENDVENTTAEDVVKEKNRDERVKKLDLSDKGLEEIPQAIGVLTEVKEIILDNNKLTDLPEEIMGLEKLEKISVKGNELCDLPDSLRQFLAKFDPFWDKSQDCTPEWIAGAEQKKIVICHVPKGNPDNRQTIEVSIHALSAHLAHGDILGPCPDGSCKGKKKDNDAYSLDSLVVRAILDDNDLKEVPVEEVARKEIKEKPVITLDGSVPVEMEKDARDAACMPQVSAVFTCDDMQVTAKSVKDLSNVVLDLADGSHQKFEDLSGYSQTFSATGGFAGLGIRGVWIKSGCNRSNDGPGYGEYVVNSLYLAGCEVKPTEKKMCMPEVSAAFAAGGKQVTVKSDKDLSNVVLDLGNGVHQKFDALYGYSQTFSAAGEYAGKSIRGVWIKSGCNFSDDGPGYGEYVANPRYETVEAVAAARPEETPRKVDRIKSLDLSGRGVGELSPAVALLDDVEELNLAGNKLEDLPAEILGLKNLNLLAVSGNRLYSLPDSIREFLASYKPGWEQGQSDKGKIIKITEASWSAEQIEGGLRFKTAISDESGNTDLFLQATRKVSGTVEIIEIATEEITAPREEMKGIATVDITTSKPLDDALVSSDVEIAYDEKKLHGKDDRGIQAFQLNRGKSNIAKTKPSLDDIEVYPRSMKDDPRYAGLLNALLEDMAYEVTVPGVWEEIDCEVDTAAKKVLFKKGRHDTYGLFIDTSEAATSVRNMIAQKFEYGLSIISQRGKYNIMYSLAKKEMVDIRIYDLNGRTVVNLVNSPCNAGMHRVVWTGVNNQQNPVGCGTYVLIMKTPSYRTERAMRLVR